MFGPRGIRLVFERCFRVAAVATAILGCTGICHAQTPNPDFDPITSRLDKGGTFYVFADLKDVFENMIAGLEPVFSESRDPQMQTLPAIARSAVKALGFDNASGIGASVLPLGDGMSRIKCFLRLKEPGGIFQLYGARKPHEPSAFRFVPQDAVFAAAQDMKLTNLLTLAGDTAAAIAGPTGQMAVRQYVEEKRKSSGIDLPKIAESLGDEWSVYLRIDPEKRTTVPVEDIPISIPKPGFVLRIAVRDAALYETVLARLKQEDIKVSSAETTGTERLEAQVIDAGGNPFGARPAVAYDKQNGVFLFASGMDEIQASLQAAADHKDVRSGSEYQRLARNMPAETNGITFASPRLTAEIARIFAEIRPKIAKSDRPGIVLLSKLLHISSGSPGHLSVRVNEPEGILRVVQGSVHPGEALQAAAAAPLAILMAVAMPAFLHAQIETKRCHTREDMRFFATALEAYFADTNVYPQSTENPGQSVRKAAPGEPHVPSFQAWGPDYAGALLTTPVAYVTQYFEDPFAPNGQTYGYYAPADQKNPGWILFSPGPDGKFDLDWKAYDPATTAPSAILIQQTYDPTNGAVSSGDIWRVKQ